MSQELKLIKKFASWNNFSKYIVNNIFCKILQARQDKIEPNLTEKQKELVIIYFHFPYYGDKGLQLLKSCIRKIAKMINQLHLRFYIVFVKLSSFAKPKIKLLLLINLLLCISSCVLYVVQNMWEKPKEDYMNYVLKTHGVMTIDYQFRSSFVFK